MKNMIVFLKNYKKECFLAPLFKGLEAFFELLVPIIMIKIIDKGIANNDKRYIFFMAFILVLLAIIGLLSAITAQYYSAVVGVGFGTELRNKLFEHILTFSHKEIDVLGKDTILTRLTNDTNQLQVGANLFFRQVLRSPFIVSGALIMSFIINIKMSLIFLFTIIILYSIVFLIMRYNIKLYRIVQKNLDKITAISNNNLLGIRVIRAFRQEQNEKEEFDTACMNLFKNQNLASKISSLMNPLTYLFINLAIVVILYKSYYAIQIGSLSGGMVIALVSYMSQILVELVKSANLILTISKSIASAKRVEEIFQIKNSLANGTLSYPKENSKTENNENTKTENNENTKNNFDLIEFKNVSFKYPNSSKEAISDISFSIKKGETIGIIGGTGSGKTSIINLIPRFYDVYSGSLLLCGKDIKEYDIKSLRKNISFIEQSSRLFEGSIRENMLWGNENAQDKDIYQALEFSMANDIIKNKEDGINSNILAMGKNLSGGQKQRLNIARNIIKDGEIIILDDATSALDYLTDSKLRENLKKLNKTLIIVSQRVISIKNADKILVIDNGKLISVGKHQDLLETCEIYKEICSSQLA